MIRIFFFMQCLEDKADSAAAQHSTPAWSNTLPALAFFVWSRKNVAPRYFSLSRHADAPASSRFPL
jgi:hypothetical protein